MDLSSEITKYWNGVKQEFGKKFAAQITQEITEIKEYGDYRMILRTLRAKIKTETQQLAVRIFRRLVEAFFATL